MKLIIAEKPMLVEAIAEALPGQKHAIQGTTYMTKGDYTLISVFGHLLELKEPEDYDEKYKNRSDLSLLPIYFENWENRVKQPDEKHKDSPPEVRLNEIGKLLGQCEYAIHAGDPDEEGQLLIDEVLRWFKFQGKVYRLDLTDLTPSGLKQAMGRLEDNKGHEAAGWSAYARGVSDAMVGYNCSRYFSAVNGANLPVGRVQTPTFGLVVRRDELIESHQKVHYFEVEADLKIQDKQVTGSYNPAKDDPNLEDGRILNRAYAQSKADMLQNETLKGGAITRKTVEEQPPLPFNLAKLTTYCGNKFGYSPQDVMDITQALREKHKAITYNRTDCQYLTERQYDEAQDTMDCVIQNLNYRPKLLDLSIKSRCFSDKHTVDAGGAHTAIIPTATRVDLAKMTEREKNVYLAICKYYMAQFMPNAKQERSKLLIPLKDGGTVSATATKTVFQGYRALFRAGQDDDVEADNANPLVDLPAGPCVADVMDARVLEKETKPPARYTQTSLAADMTCIAKYVDDPKAKELLRKKDEDKPDENGSIGTPATRAAIISNLIRHGYLEEQGKYLVSTPKAREFYRILPDELKKADMTAFWWLIQEDIRTGKSDYRALTNNVLKMITRVIHTDYPRLSPELAAQLSSGGKARVPLGTCPRCGKAVIEGKNGFGCSGFREGCKFVIWKNSKMRMLSKTTITATQAKTWLSQPWENELDENGAPTGRKQSGKAVTLKKLQSREGKDFQSEVYLVDDPNSEYGPDYKLAGFGEKIVVGACPWCGGEVTEFGQGYSCSSDDCKFVIWKKAKGGALSKVTISARDAAALLAGKTVQKKGLVSKAGKSFEAGLKLKDNPGSQYGAEFEFVFSDKPRKGGGGR